MHFGRFRSVGVEISVYGESGLCGFERVWRSFWVDSVRSGGDLRVRGERSERFGAVLDAF